MIKVKGILFSLITIGLCLGSYNPVYSQNNSITIWVIYDKNVKNALDSIIELYKERQNAQINIRYRIIPWENARDIFENKASFIKEVNESGIPPDIIQVPSTWSAHLIQEGLLYDLTNQDWIDRDSYYQPVWETCVQNEHIYAVPWFIDVRVLYYRKDILKQLGLNENDLRTWNSFKYTLDTIQKRKIQLEIKIIQSTGEEVFVPITDDKKDSKKILNPLGITASMDKRWNAIHNIIAPHYWARTGGAGIHIDQFLDENGRVRVPLILKRDIAFYRQLVAKFTSISDMYLSFDEIQEGFVKGKYAMHFSGPFLINHLKQKWGNEWNNYFGIVQIPGMEAGHYTFVGGSHLGIYRNSASIGEVLRFLRFLATDTGAQKMYAFKISQIPALRNLQNTLGYDPNFLNVPTWKTYPFNTIWFRIEKILLTEIRSWFSYFTYGEIRLIFKYIMSFIIHILDIILAAIVAFYTGWFLKKLHLWKKQQKASKLQSEKSMR